MVEGALKNKRSARSTDTVPLALSGNAEGAEGKRRNPKRTGVAAMIGTRAKPVILESVRRKDARFVVSVMKLRPTLRERRITQKRKCIL